MRASRVTGFFILGLMTIFPAQGGKAKSHEPDQRPNQVHYDPAQYGPERPLQELIAEQGLPLADNKLAGVRVKVIKAKRRLDLYVGERMIKAYRIQLSRRSEGDKERRSDMHTPEGEYFICGRNPGSKYHRGLILSYPSVKDAERGLEKKRLTQAQYEAIVAAQAAKRCPPMNTKLGGWIMLHGQDPQVTRLVRQYQEKRKIKTKKGSQPGDRDPAALTKHYDWTLGCVALLNPDIRELFDLLPDGTPVTILGDAPLTKPPAP